MAEASILVDLLNPGQVFACLGFLEAADVLLGEAEGGFDWHDESAVRFALRANGTRNPVEVVLAFLAGADVRSYAPPSFTAPQPKKRRRKNGVEVAPPEKAERSDTFPAPNGDPMALPVRLVGSIDGQQRSLCIGHWADASSRNDFKLYSGNRSAANIARAMLRGRREKARKRAGAGDGESGGLGLLWDTSRDKLIEEPFHALTPMGGSFNFDPRGAWTAIDAGYSPNDHKRPKHWIAASPVVEILSAVGLEHARPHEYETRQVRYGAWGSRVPPMLARPALAGARLGIPVRAFHFTLALSGKNKVVTFAHEESSR